MHLQQRRVVEVGEQLGLVDEAPEPDREGLCMGGRLDLHGQALGGALGHRRRQVFLDRHLPLQRDVGGEVDDAEAALAQHAFDAVVMDARARRQGVALRPVRQRDRRLQRLVAHGSARLGPGLAALRMWWSGMGMRRGEARVGGDYAEPARRRGANIWVVMPRRPGPGVACTRASDPRVIDAPTGGGISRRAGPARRRTRHTRACCCAA